MTDDLIERINAACVGHPSAKIPWPHRLLHEAAARIRELEATPAPVTVSEAARIVWDDCLQKSSPEAARQRKKAIKAIMKLKIPSIPMAQRWAIVNVALRALAGQGGEA